MIEIPCKELPKAKPLSIALPFGGKLQSMINIADGPPSDCAVAHSLMLQITPMMASMTCLLHMLKVVSALKTTVESGFTKSGDLLTAIGDMSDCLGIVLGPLPLCSMIKDILQLILAYLNCMIEAVESILNFQVGIDLNAAQGNPVMLAQLECAQTNAQNALEGTMNAMVGLEPIFELINTAMSIIGEEPIGVPDLSAETPSLADLADGQDPLEPVKTVVETIETIISALPC